MSDVAAAAAGVSAGSVFVKRSDDASARFAEVDIFEADTVARLAKRASLELEWRTPAAYVDLFLVKPGGVDEPSAAEEEKALKQSRVGVGWPLSRAGIASGAWVIARLLSPLVAAPGGCAQETCSLPSCSLSRGAGEARGTAREIPLWSTTARRFSSTSTFVLDGPIPDARGQPGVEFLYAFCGSRVCCAKVGPRTALEHELRVSAAVHAASIAPTVVCAAALETVTRRAATEPYAALMMPLYSMTVGTASLAMDTGVGAALDAFALNVALCALAAIKAFDLAGFSHGDIKPSNLLIAGDSTGVLVLCDLGTARMRGEPFAESSAFSLNLVRTASLRYDVVSLGATLASLLSARINVGLCGDVAALREVIAGLPQRFSPLWRFVDACLSFAEDGAAAELELLRSLLAGIADEMRSALGPHSATILRDQDVWPRPRG